MKRDKILEISISRSHTDLNIERTKLLLLSLLRITKKKT